MMDYTEENSFVELYDARGGLWGIECKPDGTECYMTLEDGRGNNPIIEFHRLIDALSWLQSEGYMTPSY
jgi:hypothetical protein